MTNSTVHRILILILISSLSPVLAGEDILVPQEKENRLAKAKSPYLLSAKYHKVDWYEYGDEAFKKAKELDKPILLDIGAIWCHWCHVMDEETYENPEVVQLINQFFIAVKVDRDERPDIDRKYQDAISAITGHGGWPLTVFLTPEGKVFYGGTYFPPEDQGDREGMKTLLPRLAQLYGERKEEILVMSERLHQELQTMSKPQQGELSRELLQGITNTLLAEGDKQHGGFGTVSKFPSASAITYLLNTGATKRDGEALQLALKTLDSMAAGGIRDHIRGGFFRYTIDPGWRIPHFEKMSYVQAEMIENYVHAYAVTGNELYKRVALEVLDYVRMEASDQDQGGFYASQDADVDKGDDGDYYTWTSKEVEKVLDPLEAKAIKAFYEIESEGEMEHNPAKNVLRIVMEDETLAEILGIPSGEIPHLLQVAREKMKKSRDSLPGPYIDNNKYTNWNGMMISAWFEAYKFLGDVTLKDFALKSLDFLLDKSYSEGLGFFHTYRDGEARITGFLEDNVQLAKACLDAHEVSGQKKYLDMACTIMDYCMLEFWDRADGGFFDLPATVRDIERKPFEDVPTPAANAIAAMVLDRLYYITHEARYYDRAQRTLQAFAGSATGLGYFVASYATALDYHLSPPVYAVIIGRKNNPETEKLHESALATYRPNKIVTVHDPSEEGFLPYPPSPEGKTIVYVCIPLKMCAPPTTEVEEMQELLRTL